jgi:hypothetical protein
MTEQDAIDILRRHGETIEDAPGRWRRRGFRYFAVAASQMLSSADLIEYARNQQSMVSTD